MGKTGGKMDRTIIALAYLRESFESNRYDYIDTIIPLYVAMFNKQQYTTIEIESIIEDFRKIYGIYIPHHPTISILNRLKKRGYITPHIPHPLRPIKLGIIGVH